MKYNYTYSQDQVDELYRYLMTKPMVESEKLVNILRKPLKLDEATPLEVINEEEKTV